MSSVQPFPDFPTSARAVLAYLNKNLPFGLWMVTRVEGDDWIVLQCEDEGYGVEAGKVFRWSDSFCSRMVRDEGPNIAPVAMDIPAYAEAPIGKQVPIGSYVGMPLNRSDDTLFGTLCAIDPETKSPSLVGEQPLLELLARLLCTHLERDMAAVEATRLAERAQAEAWTDALTGLYNRRGWDHLLSTEEERCRRYGDPAYVLAIDLDGLKKVNDTEGHAAGDDLIARAALALQGAIRTQDIVARVGGDEFVALLVECDAASGAAMTERLIEALSAVGVEASVGCQERDPALGLACAWKAADALMYDTKRARKLLAPDKIRS